MGKPKIKWYQYLAVGSFVAGWVSRSLPDKKVTKDELEELLNGILEMLDMDEIEIG